MTQIIQSVSDRRKLQRRQRERTKSTPDRSVLVTALQLIIPTASTEQLLAIQSVLNLTDKDLVATLMVTPY